MQGAAKGEENILWDCYPEQERYIHQRAAGLPKPTRTFAILLVRDPLPRYASGVFEVLKLHCGFLHKWIAAKNKNCEGKNCLHPVDCFSWKKGTKEYPRRIDQYLEYEAAGWNNVHTIPQSAYARAPTAWTHPREAMNRKNKLTNWDAVVRLEYNLDWIAIGTAIGDLQGLPRNLPGELPHSTHSNHAGSKYFNMTSRAWDLFCHLHGSEYDCLNYTMPLECRSRQEN